MASEGEAATSANRPRLLIPVTILFAVRYVIRSGLIDLLREHAEPVICLSWDDPDLVAELSDLGVDAVRLPDPQVSAEALANLAVLESAFERRLASPSTRIDRARRSAGRSTAERLKRWVRWRQARLAALRPGAERRAAAHLAATASSTTNLDENLALLRDLDIDAVFSVTPFAAQERVLLLAAERAGLPCATAILSFDNVTTRPPLPIVFDRYLVWNRFNRDEIVRSTPGVDAGRIAIVGPAQFDFYADPSLVDDERAWRERLGLAPEHRTVLYGAGAVSVAPHETQHVDDLCAAIDRGRLPSDLRIVVRRHPMDAPDRWERFGTHPAVVFDDPGRLGTEQYRPGHVDLGDEQVRGLCSTLAHTDVHVSVSSTMSLDGAFFDKPQVAPAYDARPGRPFDRHARALYRREHFVPIVESGGIDLVHGPDELVDAVDRALRRPDLGRQGRERMLAELCTFTDGRCVPRVAAGVADALSLVGARR